MGSGITRRDLLRRGAGAVGAVGFASLTGFGSLARAMAAEGGGDVGPLTPPANKLCGGPESQIIYGCRTSTYCTQLPPHSCGVGYDCNVDVTCTSQGPTAESFQCWQASGSDPYGCTERTFTCMPGPEDSRGDFDCGNGDPPGTPYDFACKTSQNRFRCDGGTGPNMTFACGTAEFYTC
jgi:hypothetical protein